MIIQIFSIYDSKIKDYANPFYMHSIGECERGFTELVNDPNSKINKYANDYHMYHLGSFDTSTGLLSPHKHPEHLFDAHTLKN